MIPRQGSAWRHCAGLIGALLAAQAAMADQSTISGNKGLSTSASLRFQITINKFVQLRLGSSDATQTDLRFNMNVTPAVTGAPGNSLAFSGGIAPAWGNSVATTNPTGSSSALTVSAFTNVPGTTISCVLAAIGGVTPFAAGATAGGVPGTNDILVGTTAGGVPHPGANLSACTGAITTPVPLVTNLGGTYTFSTAFLPGGLTAGTYGAAVTYTISAP